MRRNRGSVRRHARVRRTADSIQPLRLNEECVCRVELACRDGELGRRVCGPCGQRENREDREYRAQSHRDLPTNSSARLDEAWYYAGSTLVSIEVTQGPSAGPLTDEPSSRPSLRRAATCSRASRAGHGHPTDEEGRRIASGSFSFPW